MIFINALNFFNDLKLLIGDQKSIPTKKCVTFSHKWRKNAKGNSLTEVLLDDSL